ncbi:MAG: rubrerythrin family protein [bacterium]
MSKTDENLKAAFGGESQASRKYLAFARKADEDGKTQTARLFRAAAMAETIHARNHLRVMGAIRSTTENVLEAIAGESHEFRKMYPEFLEEAKEEKNTEAVRSFDMANKVEEIHHGLYQKALAAIEMGEDLPLAQVWVCEICGNTLEGWQPQKCSICGAPREKFAEIDGRAGADRSVIC